MFSSRKMNSFLLYILNSESDNIFDNSDSSNCIKSFKYVVNLHFRKFDISYYKITFQQHLLIPGSSGSTWMVVSMNNVS